MSTEGTQQLGTQQKGEPGAPGITAATATGRLLRFLFSPPALGPVPRRAGGFAARLAKSPVDLVTRLGMERANAYYAAGCPLELCEHAAARDLWLVIYSDAVAGAEGESPKSEVQLEGGVDYGNDC